MSKATNAAIQYIEELAHDANALLAATSDIASDRVSDARERLADALDNGRDVYKKLRKQAIKGARRADEAVRDNPYAPIGVALVLGGLLVFLFTRRRH
jgi:ElaB/YqjD/DUF883 family membrane-anchored ribosome-binding protein